MQISKLLETATAKYDDFYQIYEAVNDKDIWEKIELDPIEKNRIEEAMNLVDDQTRELMVIPLSRLKSKSPSRLNLWHENKKKCNFGDAWSSLNCNVSSNKKIKRYAWIELYYEFISKEGPWGLGMAISFHELRNMESHSPERIKLERELKKTIGHNWATTEEMITYWTNIGVKEEDINAYVNGGGYVWFKKPLELKAGMEIENINDFVVEIGYSFFVKKIPELKKFWQNKLQGIGV